MFEKCEYQNEQNGQFYPMYRITRDGFVLLAMGFTGSKALEWKLRYIAAFNEMEEKLRAANAPALADNRIEIARLVIKANASKLAAIRALYPEYFAGQALPGTLEHTVDVNTSYRRWIEDCDITREWIGDFPTTDIYYNYIRYCNENRMMSMGKKTFYNVLRDDFNVVTRQTANGHRYFRDAV